MREWHESDVLTNGIRLHTYRTCTPAEASEKTGSVVLCHGYSAEALLWSALARRLKDEYDVIMLDARFHGRSEAPREASEADAMSHDLAGVIAALGLERPVVAGNSMGASYVFRTAALYPDLMRAIILEDPVWVDGPRSGPPRDPQAELAHFAESSLETLEAEYRAMHPAWDQETVSLIAAARKRLDPRVLGRSTVRRDWRETLAQITCPILLFTGDPEQGAIVTDAVAQAALALYPKLEHCHIPHTGHNIRYDALDAYAQVFKRFLARQWA